ncbi:MAG: sigma-70 family RNA polymerase sigma factor [Rudanella sp.]|nr:sigma-70 family RNA polymerase sigma factor [Rudanella sp.]
MPRIIPFFQSESQLMTALKRNDNRAQKVVYERYSGKMMAVCVRYIANGSDAEETMIDGFMRAFERIGQFREEGSFEGWLRRIMVTESLMFLRKTKSWRQEIGLDEIITEPDYDWADNSLEADDLLRLVGQLPDGYRTIFNLYAIEGYTHQEIANELGISEGTSKSQLSRARLWLQTSLVKLEREYGQANRTSAIR